MQADHRCRQRVWHRAARTTYCRHLGARVGRRKAQGPRTCVSIPGPIEDEVRSVKKDRPVPSRRQSADLDAYKTRRTLLQAAVSVPRTIHSLGTYRSSKLPFKWEKSESDSGTGGGAYEVVPPPQREAR